jgi:hypothetical protein
MPLPVSRLVKKGLIQNIQKELSNYEIQASQVTITTNPNGDDGLSGGPFLLGLGPNPCVGRTYTVADRGGFFRVWQRTVPVTNDLSGQISRQFESYTELGDGIHYWDNGWVESKDVIELTPSGAEAVHGQMKASFNSDITSIGAITLTTPAGEVFQTRPLGLFYLDSASSKVARIASVQFSQGRLYPPNVLVYSNVLSGLKADLMLVWAKNGYEQNLVLKQAPPRPEAFGLSSTTTRLQLWSAMDSSPEPQEQRPVVLNSGLVDHILFFNGCWFPVGAAFVLGPQALPTDGKAVPIRLVSPSDPGSVPVAKSLVTISDFKVLIEELNYTDLASSMSSLPQAAVSPKAPLAKEFAKRDQLLPASPSARPHTSPLQVAGGGYSPSGVVLDYTSLSGNASTYTFTSGSTYLVRPSFVVGPGTAYFQQNACIKFDNSAYLLLTGTVTFPGTSQVIFTSKDDNQYGQIMPDSTTMPGYSAGKAIWIYYPTAHTAIQNALVRCAGRCVRYDQSVTGLAPSLTSSAFQRSFIGVEVNIPGDTLYLSQVTSCTVPTAVSLGSGNVSGSITPDCGVLSVAMVNDPNRDLSGLDPNKNSQSECSFVLPDSSTVVAAFWNTHLSEYGLGVYFDAFPGISSPRSVSWAKSVNGGASFSDQGTLPPISPNRNLSEGDVGDPVTAYAPGVGGPNGTIYVLVNPSREPGNLNGFRLWTSTDKGSTFSLLNNNVPNSASVLTADKPMIKVNGADLYVSGKSSGTTTIWAAHSSNGGSTWDSFRTLETAYPSNGSDIAIAVDGTVYVLWLQGTGGGPYVNKLRYAWLSGGSWSTSRDFGITLNSTQQFASGNPLRSKTAPSSDYFESNGFPRVAVANGRIYVVYADLPASWASTGDRGDIFVAEAVINGDHSLAAPTVRSIYVGNVSDQWNPSVAVTPLGTQVFIGYYSRQNDDNNSSIMAYAARANITNGLVNATFDSFPVSPTAFPPLFAGTSAPAQGGWAYDPVWPQAAVCLDANAAYQGVYDGQTLCANQNLNFGTGTDSTYVHFCADDYTWAGADSSYFYFAWCDRSSAFGSPPNTRPDADVKFARIRQ